ncbi:tRNA lysidine(34) synthetase TilS [Desulfofalx alkaliphila]|uniref:tRNA lysidine(34) synthetase TilS n=1 Tax=Desulfofalx alkaliphila TaxID=105483 RepID=UPI0004E0FF0D|nr:tRNA lysidine(34) synthetase TilS [Desulfofalx alkaliphila]
MDLIGRVLEYIYSNKMVDPGDKVLVAVSGGADSVALLHMLFRLSEQLNMRLHVAHLNHMFRGRESEEDALFVEALCDKWQIPKDIKSMDVTEYQGRHRLSAQVAAREVRYNFLKEVARKRGCNKIALAHHADDQAETVLLNLLRGTGITGLTGIWPVRDNFYIRPLLPVRRREIESYCFQNKLHFRNDSSNQEEIYLRNKVRKSLLPLIEKDYNQEIVTLLNRLADISRDEDDFIEGQSQRDFAALLTDPKAAGSLPLDRLKFNGLHRAIQRRVVRQAWRTVTGSQRDLSFYHVESVVKLAASTGGGILELPTGLLCKVGSRAIEFKYPPVEKPVNKFCYRLKIPGTTIIKEADMQIVADVYSAAHLKKDPRMFRHTEAVLDYGSVGHELLVRNRLPGDVFKPLGGGRVKLKKFFIDQKIPRAERDAIPLVCKGKEIIWVSGVRVGEYWKVTENTEEILHLKLVKMYNKP